MDFSNEKILALAIVCFSPLWAMTPANITDPGSFLSLPPRDILDTTNQYIYNAGTPSRLNQLLPTRSGEDLNELIARYTITPASTVEPTVSQGFTNIEPLLKAFPENPALKQAAAKAFATIFTIALHDACLQKNVELVKLLIGTCSDVNKLGLYNQGPLYCAVLSGSLPILELLATAGATINDHCGTLALNVAIRQGDPEITQWLINHNAPINAPRGLYELTPLMIAISEHGNNGENGITIVQQLIVAGADVNARSGDLTALGYAQTRVARGEQVNPDFITLLERAGAHE